MLARLVLAATLAATPVAAAEWQYTQVKNDFSDRVVHLAGVDGERSSFVVSCSLGEYKAMLFLEALPPGADSGSTAFLVRVDKRPPRTYPSDILVRVEGSAPVIELQKADIDTLAAATHRIFVGYTLNNQLTFEDAYDVDGVRASLEKLTDRCRDNT